MKPIRKQYESMGVEGYYSAHAEDYANPHFSQIRELLYQNESHIDYRRVLDFCCGHGEVCRILTALGYGDFTGCDPFTYQAFETKIAVPCLRWSFEDVIRGKLEGRFSSIICSFAMHLCPPKQLFPLAYQLFQRSDQLIIITPHKRPQLEALDGVVLQFEDYTLTPKGKKVRLKSYRWA